VARHFFRRILPDADRVAHHRWLRHLGLRDPRFWYVNRRSIAAGLAAGVYFGLLLPTGQMPVAVLVAVMLRCNLPAALLGTFVSNPITFVPIYLVAYRIGASLLNLPPDESWATAFDKEASGLAEYAEIWWSAVWHAGKPLAVGLFIVATVSAGAVYGLVNLVWRTSTRRRFSRRNGR